MNLNSEVISSRNNSFVKWVASLNDKKKRNSEGYFMAEGVKLTCEAFEAKLPVEFCIVNESKKNDILDKLMPYFTEEYSSSCKLVTVTDNVFEKISTEKSPQGVISIIKHLDFFRKMDIIYKEEFFLEANEKAIFLCSIRDPSNLGSVIRSSVAFGTEHIVLSDDCADIYSPKTVRSAMGSLYRVKVTTVSDIASFIDASHANGRRIFAAELSDGAKSLNEVGLKSSDIVMIGNEGHGIPTEISSLCDGSVYIPISKKTESLNASVAAAIFMWEQSKNI